MQPESMLDFARQNAELKTRVEELTRALGEREAMMQLMAGAVHDLRNAFHISLLAAETLLLSVKQPAAVALIEEVVAAAEHGTTLARDLLAMVRKSDAQISVLPCAQFLEGLSSMLRRGALEGCECAFDISPDAWPVLVQRPQLEAALINLCVNARHALAEGGRARVAVRNWPCGRAPTPAQSAGDYVEFSVSDTGAGMPPAVLARATEAFFTTRADRGGTGLGLAMAHAFAARSGGALLIDSTVGRGTCVRLVLPRAPLPLTADPELSGKLHEVRQRIRSPALKQALEMWGALCPPAGLPRPVAAEGGLTAQSEHCLVLEVDSSASPPMLRLSHIGGALARALGPRRVDDLAIDGSLEVGTLGAAYRRTLQARFPSYEYARISLGADVPAVFERLILPAAVDGHAVSHLIGIVYLSDNLRNGGSVMLSANTVMGVGSFLDVPAAELAERLNQLDETAMDRLSFGVIRLDASGKVVFYSDSEAKQSGFGDSHALGLAFFTQLAPCMAMPELVRKVEDAQGRGELDIIFDHVGDFADAERKLLVRMISAPERGAWVLLQRQDTPALH